MEGQLTSLQEEAEVRQAEMQAAIDTLRQDKRALEAQVAGVNLHAVEAGDPLVLQVRAWSLKSTTQCRFEPSRSIGGSQWGTGALCCGLPLSCSPLEAAAVFTLPQKQWRRIAVMGWWCGCR